MKRYKAGIKYHFEEANYGDKKNSFTRASVDFRENEDGDWIKYEAAVWKKFDWNDPETHPEEYRKIWIVSDTFLFEQEEIAYFGDGQFYYSNTENAIDVSILSNIWWQYVALPQRPPKL
jgi:hypothetical protein